MQATRPHPPRLQETTAQVLLPLWQGRRTHPRLPPTGGERHTGRGTNGAAENFVGVFKNKVTKIIKEGKSVEHAINLFQFDYRASAYTTTGRSLASLLYKRELRTRFDLLKPNVKNEVEGSQAAQIKHRPGNRCVSFKPGNVVMVDDHRVRNRKRVKATITKQLSPVTFKVQVSPSLSWKRHVDQTVVLGQVEESSQTRKKETMLELTLRRSARVAAQN